MYLIVGIKPHADDCIRQSSNAAPNPFLTDQPSKRQNCSGLSSPHSLFSEKDKFPKNEEGNILTIKSCFLCELKSLKYRSLCWKTIRLDSTGVEFE